MRAVKYGTLKGLPPTAQSRRHLCWRRRLEVDCRLSLDTSPHEASDQGENKQHDRHPKQELSACHCRSGNAAEPQRGGDQGNNQEHQGPIEKIAQSFLLILSFSISATIGSRKGFTLVIWN